MANEVFISYSRKDYEIVNIIKGIIDQAVGIDCWMDLEGIRSNETFENVLIDAIIRHDTFLFMMTKNSMNSKWALKELYFAEKKRKKIILVNVDGSNMTDKFLFRYSDKNIIDWNSPAQKEILINDLRTWYSPQPIKITNPSEKKQKSSSFESFFVAVLGWGLLILLFWGLLVVINNIKEWVLSFF